MQDLLPFFLSMLTQQNFNISILKGFCLLLTADMVNYQAFSIPSYDNTKSIFAIVSYLDTNNHQECYSIKIKRKKNHYTSKLSLNKKQTKEGYSLFLLHKARERKEELPRIFSIAGKRLWVFLFLQQNIQFITFMVLCDCRKRFWNLTLCAEIPQAKVNKLERCKRISVAWEIMAHKIQVTTCIHDCNDYATDVKLLQFNISCNPQRPFLMKLCFK